MTLPSIQSIPILSPSHFQAVVENTTSGNITTPADSIDLYAGALDGVALGVVLQGPVQRLLRSCVIQVHILQIIAQLLKTGKAEAPIHLAVSNPFNATMKITRIDLVVKYKNQTVAIADPHRRVNPFNPIVLQPYKEDQVIPTITIQFILGINAHRAPPE